MSAVHPDGRVAYYEGEKGAERVVRIEWPEPDARVEFYEGESRKSGWCALSCPMARWATLKAKGMRSESSRSSGRMDEWRILGLEHDGMLHVSR